jgi:hypothetical protein
MTEVKTSMTPVIYFLEPTLLLLWMIGLGGIRSKT